MRAYVLVLMSVDRCLATVHSETRSYSMQRVAVIAVVTGMIVICMLLSPTLTQFHVLEYMMSAEERRSACVMHFSVYRLVLLNYRQITFITDQ